MRSRWLTLSEVGHQDVAVGMLREGQLELAYQRLTQMRHEGVKVQPWLYDMAVYALLEAEELEEAMSMIKVRIQSGEYNLSKNVWHQLLEQASSAFHHAATSFAWQSQVVPAYIQPSLGVCQNVLATAARYGDVKLATEVFRQLGERATIFTAMHYEELLKTYMNAEKIDLRAALSILVIMADGNIMPTPACTRPLFIHFQHHPKSIQEAVHVLHDLRTQHRQVPLAALNLLLEAFAADKDFEQALNLYKIMHTFEPQEEGGMSRKLMANVDTFNSLYRAARMTKPPSIDAAMFLASEQLALGVVPNRITYDRLMLLCLEAGRVEDAWKYLMEMDEQDWLPRMGSLRHLAKKLAGQHDERCWDVVQRIKDAGGGAESMIEEFERAQQESPVQPEARPAA